MKYTRNLLLIGHTATFYQQMLDLINRELTATGGVPKTIRKPFLNSLGLAISYLPVDLAACIIDMVHRMDEEYLKTIKKMLVDSKGDCEKILIINSFQTVSDITNITTILGLQWRCANPNQQESIALHVSKFITYSSSFSGPPTPLWATIQQTIQADRETPCSKTARQHLETAEIVLNRHFDEQSK